MTTETHDIPGYVYSGDVSPLEYGGRWFGVTPDNIGHVIEVIGIADLRQPAWEADSPEYAIIESKHIFVRGHVEMRQAIESCGWEIRKQENRDIRRAMMLDAYFGYYGGDTDQDFGGNYSERVTTDDALTAQLNRWAD